MVPGNPTYTAGMEIQAKDPTTMISLRGSNYNDTQEGKLMKFLALADKELDLDGDGIPRVSLKMRTGKKSIPTFKIYYINNQALHTCKYLISLDIIFISDMLV